MLDALSRPPFEPLQQIELKVTLCNNFTLKYQFQSLSIGVLDYYSENGISPITTEGPGGLHLDYVTFDRGSRTLARHTFCFAAQTSFGIRRSQKLFLQNQRRLKSRLNPNIEMRKKDNCCKNKPQTL